jgi:hypothetical protein
MAADETVGETGEATAPVRVGLERLDGGPAAESPDCPPVHARTATTMARAPTRDTTTSAKGTLARWRDLVPDIGAE